ncbi:phosphopentomutase [Caldalkalibacillus salinus]|uniref:phosphopentomutase n=1 Tax=Caldalkalibacillus salinus TaxID=2803787 RepID=UPI001924DCC9|nr:phosphopentomutase [Caldalkalibacillus salinus]
MSTDQHFKRVFLIVMDSVGVGELPDAPEFNDEGAHTLGHIAEKMNGLRMPNMQKLGLGNIVSVQGIDPVDQPLGVHGKMKEISAGKDTMTGHYEIMGLKVEEPFRTFTETGFPRDLIEAFEKRVGRKVIGNKAASGTEILKELGPEHMETGHLIVYTSSDSVFQIAAHEEIVPLDELYEICEVARELTLEDPYKLGRVIARPFVGKPGAFERTPNRRDYALSPFAPTVMSHLKEANFDSIALGKISDIYDGEGVTDSVKTKSNEDGMHKLLEQCQRDLQGLVFLNLVDFDAVYGHRRDPVGYGKALEAFDQQLAEVLPALKEDDLLMITADHGNDPVHHGTDHTREYVPVIAYTPSMKKTVDLGVRATFADIGATVADIFNVKAPSIGKSFLPEINQSVNH